nr:protein RTF1 homolog [Tanacetum cinerariifolium]
GKLFSLQPLRMSTSNSELKCKEKCKECLMRFGVPIRVLVGQSVKFVPIATSIRRRFVWDNEGLCFACQYANEFDIIRAMMRFVCLCCFEKRCLSKPVFWWGDHVVAAMAGFRYRFHTRRPEPPYKRWQLAELVRKSGTMLWANATRKDQHRLFVLIVMVYDRYDHEGDSDGDSVGSNLYKGDEERRRLAKMSEFNIEMIMVDRLNKRTDKDLQNNIRSRKRSQISREKTAHHLTRQTGQCVLLLGRLIGQRQKRNN